MAAQRLRRTFKYPSESDDEDAVEAGMDAQDQQTLLTTLTQSDKSTTHTYTLALLVLPLTLAAAYVPQLFTSSPTQLLNSVVGTASLLASAYTLYFLPLPPRDPLKDEMQTKNKNATGGGTGGGSALPTRPTPPWEKIVTSGRRPVPYISAQVADLLAEYIVIVNRAVCGVVALLELRSEREWLEGFMVGGGYLPLVVCMIILYARTELRIIDMDALEMLRAGGGGEKRG